MVKTLPQKIMSNTMYNMLGRVWAVAIAIFLTPYIVGSIGVEKYGVWALVSVVTGYFGLLDLGIGSAYVKFISEYYAKKDSHSINRIVNSGLFFYCLFTVGLFGLAFISLDLILKFLNIPAVLLEETVFLFWVGLATFSVSNAASVFVAVQNGLQRMDVYNKISLVVSIPNTVGIVFAIHHGYGLRGLIVANAVTMLLSGVLNVYFAYRLMPELRLAGKYLSYGMFLKLFDYGYKLQIARVSSTVSAQIDKLLLTHYLSVASVTFFQLGSSVVEQAKSLPMLLLSALVPAFSELDARGDREKILEGYVRGTKYIAMIAIPLFTFLIVSGGTIIMLWMGPGYESSTLVIRILAFGWGVAVVSGVRSAVLQAIGKPQIEMNSGLIAAVFNVPLSVIFIRYFGFLGVAFGTSIALILSAVYGFEFLNRELRVGGAFYYRAYLPQLTVISAAAGGIVSLIPLAMSFEAVDRLSAFLLLAGQGVLFVIIYSGLLAKWRPLDTRDVSMLSRANNRFLTSGAKVFSV